MARVHLFHKSFFSNDNLRRVFSQDLSGEDLVNLPSRTLTNRVQLEEYTRETIDGQMLKTFPSRKTGNIEKYELVTWRVNDPENPKNWTKSSKWWCTMVVALVCFVVAFNSAVITADIEGVAEEFHVSEEVVLLSITLFVVGFGVGPMAFAPISELVGRKKVYCSTLLVAVVFIVPSAVAKNISTLLVTRAIDGIAFSAPMTLVGGTLADLWKSEERGVPMAAFSTAPFIGPAIGPLIGGFLSDALGWRWLYWIQLILSGVVWLLITFTVPETYAPTLLSQRARKLRAETGSPQHVTEQDLDIRPLSQRLHLFLLPPATLMFIPIAVGVLLSAACSPLINRHYLTSVRKHNGKPPAEVRLIPMMFSCWFIPIGLFIFAWTSYPRLHWIGPALGGFPVGFGFIFLYNSANNYLVDTYQHQAASALAAKTFLRSFWGAAVVLFTNQMYDRLGFQWAGTLLAFIGLACCAIPYVFWIWGERIRRRSKYAYSGDDEENIAKM
ncbi:MFS multidrug transporter [Patellaria atrata CBS 101060]|uniref:MFS multidrug transporter n=1 Tax=Patellaria atrata CBS 101060 TaxID=1346257 RepID=A0A9P4VPQ0_9PEZI|nr:MFS multidrug transporter [Patellaria atrata CBS 101060]